MKLTVDIPDESVAPKVILFLNNLKSDGVKFEQDQEIKAEFSNKYLQDNWMELVMTHEDPNIDDDNKLERAHASWENP
ncbi:hypothetical protein [Methyloprofundus sp.]|uniref:hypothetical protein n=1 Tax=Methyloprofundus sp. TaxID=2020875 RepID=UPI003D0B13AE